MFRWKDELAYLSRYSGSGLLNTTLGFSIIFMLTGFGVTPFIANAAGYSIGLIVGFALLRKYVFRSEARPISEIRRYLLSFIAAFLCNVLVLYLALNELGLHPVTAQMLAALSYALFMYLLSRVFVFLPKPKAIE